MKSPFFFLEKSLAYGDFPIALATAYLANTYRNMGNNLKSDSLHQTLMDRVVSEHHVSLALAVLEAGRDNPEQMFFWLEKAFELKDFGIAFFLNVDPIFDPYKSDRRFVAIRNQMLYEQAEPVPDL